MSDAGPAADPALVEEAVFLAREAGRRTLRWFGARDLAVATKADGTPVTDADRVAERWLREALAERHPDDEVRGEEEPDTPGRSGRRWIVDPIDGTKAFTRGVPLYGTLVAVEDGAGPLVGVIALPALDEAVWAGRGSGCFWNGSACRVSRHPSLAGAYVMTSAVDHWPPGGLAALAEAGAHVRTWGDGYGYALVASGRAEAMVDPVTERWDLAAMPVILAEAGGRFTDLTGAVRSDSGHGLATNGLLHDEVLRLLRDGAPT